MNATKPIDDRQIAITWTNIDPDLFPQISSLV